MKPKSLVSSCSFKPASFITAKRPEYICPALFTRMSTLPKRCRRALHQPRDVRLLRHVGDDRVNFAARRRGELGAGALYRFRVAAADRDAHALLEKLARGLPPYAAAAAGDDRRPALDAEIHSTQSAWFKCGVDRGTPMIIEVTTWVWNER